MWYDGQHEGTRETCRCLSCKTWRDMGTPPLCVRCGHYHAVIDVYTCDRLLRAVPSPSSTERRSE